MRVVGGKHDRTGQPRLFDKLYRLLIGLHRDIALALEILARLKLQIRALVATHVLEVLIQTP